MKRWTVLALLLVVGAQATVNGPLPFSADYHFAEGFTDGHITLISGAAEVDLVAREGTYAAFNTENFVISDLTRACWDLATYFANGETDGVGCATSPSGNLEMRVVSNGSVAYRFPVATSGQFQAAHVLGYPVDFAFQDEVKEMGLGEALLLSSVEGEMAPVAVPAFTGQGQNRNTYGALAPINEQTSIEVYRDGALLHTTGPNQQFLAFDSTIGATVEPFQTPFALLPFESGSTATFTQADAGPAREGFDLQNLQDNLNSLADASEGNADEMPEGVENIEVLLSEVLDGGLISVPGEVDGAGELIETGELIRFEEVVLRNEGASNGALAWDGSAPLQIRGGNVQGADGLVFLVPWWSFLLWGVAIALVITRIALKKPKTGPIDKYAWIGWVGSVLMSLLLFWLWDMEVARVWGTSILTTDAGREGLAATALLQLVPWSLVSVAVTLPLRSIGASAVRLAGLGKGARLSAVLMPVFGFLLGATLLLDFMGALLEFAVGYL